MEIELTDRVREAKDRAQEYLDEIRDYEMIVMLIRALGIVKMDTDKYQYTQDEFDKCVKRLYRLCAKHEIQLPDNPELIDWDAIQIK